MHEGKIILGIDPGTTIMGYGIVQVKHKKPALVALGIVEMHKFSNHYLKLKHIFERTTGLIDQYRPDELAIEAPFYGKNVQSMLKLGRAQGAAISAALSRDIPIFEYSPRKIKLAITGNGGASKEQVAMFLKNILAIDKMPRQLDATDGLAAAMCHCYRKNIPTGSGGQSKNWKDFIKNNPDRIK